MHAHVHRCSLRGTASLGTDLLLEVADGVLIRICEEVQNIMLYMVFFKMVHQVCSIALWN